MKPAEDLSNQQNLIDTYYEKLGCRIEPVNIIYNKTLL